MEWRKFKKDDFTPYNNAFTDKYVWHGKVQVIRNKCGTLLMKPLTKCVLKLPQIIMKDNADIQLMNILNRRLNNTTRLDQNENPNINFHISVILNTNRHTSEYHKYILKCKKK